MVIQAENLQYTLFRADNAQAIQNMFYIQDRAGLGVATAESLNTAKADQVTVHATTPTEGNPIREDEKGALAYEGGGLVSEESRKEEEQEKQRSPDGKGIFVDIRA